MDNKIIIATDGLSKKFNDNWVLSNLDIQVNKGQIYGLLGPQDSGKSIVLKILTGLVKPTKGKFELFGIKNSALNNKVYKRVGALIGEPGFYPYLTGKQNLIHLSSLSKDISESKVEETLEMVNLENQQDMKVKDYAPVFKKRLGIAQAIVHDPEFLILDEPTFGLEPEGMQKIHNYIKLMADEYGKTIFLTSHNLKEVQSLCTHMGLINYGKLVKEGAVKELLNTSELFVTEVVVDQPQQALNLLLNQNWINKISMFRNKLKLHIANEKRPILTKFLVEQGFKVYSIQSRSSVEDYYISLLRKENSREK